MIRVGVVGAAGRMGEEVCRAIGADPATELVAKVDIGDSLDLLTEAAVDVVVDFTVLSVARQTLTFAAANGIHAVVGTTG
ncbi:MAG: 4-hydroxy-tetrahydrodipicolinate reductase, partial [Acidimicrobiales bacterium]